MKETNIGLGGKGKKLGELRKIDPELAALEAA